MDLSMRHLELCYSSIASDALGEHLLCSALETVRHGQPGVLKAAPSDAAMVPSSGTEIVGPKRRLKHTTSKLVLPFFWPRRCACGWTEDFRSSFEFCNQGVEVPFSAIF